MTRFSSPEEVLAWADTAAAGDLQYHLRHGSDLNPYSTEGRRADWERGYHSKGARSWESAEVILYDTAYQRGAAMRRLIEGDTDEH